MVTRTQDMEAVARILNHSKVYGLISDDGALSAYIPGESQFYIINDSKTGVVRLDPLNAICCIAHIATLPELWGKAVDFAKESIDWGFKNTTFSKVVAMVPDFNRLTVRLCMKCGFEKEGEIKKSYLKNWKFYDQIVFGLTKTDFYKGE